MEAKPLPSSKQSAFLDCPLYGVYTLDGLEEEGLVKFFFGGGTLDAWCPKCESASVFKISSQLPSYGEPKKSLPHSGPIVISASCSRGAEDSNSGCRAPLTIVFFKDYKEVRKIGQNPSAADLALGSLDEAFEKELDPDKRRELGTAIGLQAHGVGIGSFVYLRRIFESLLEEAHLQGKTGKGWDETQYWKVRTPERIWSNTPTFTVSADEAQAILKEVGGEAEEVGLEDFREGLQVELEHGTRFPDANVTNNHPVLTGKTDVAQRGPIDLW